MVIDCRLLQTLNADLPIFRIELDRYTFFKFGQLENCPDEMKSLFISAVVRLAQKANMAGPSCFTEDGIVIDVSLWQR